ncbi:hypothetical protein HK096_010839 [Nowakowskiella sp. JEL0078]|nr:hypothetical protein HK096_010839 [Nowakowskiella sp. JEL0078]
MSKSVLVLLAFLAAAVGAQWNAEKNANKVVDRFYGLAKPDRVLYQSLESQNQFKCLDGSLTIPFTSINDDYCDCPDGSDEPGTSACENGRFLCENTGHVSMYLPSSKVNDGICDPECCDGSDEYSGVIACPNKCIEAGENTRKKDAETQKIRKIALRTKKTYTDFGKNLKVNRINELKSLKSELETYEPKIKIAKTSLEKAEKDNLKRKDQLAKIIKENTCTSQLDILAECASKVSSLKDRAKTLKTHAIDASTKSAELLDQLTTTHKIVKLLADITQDSVESLRRQSFNLEKAFQLVDYFKDTWGLDFDILKNTENDEADEAEEAEEEAVEELSYEYLWDNRPSDDQVNQLVEQQSHVDIAPCSDPAAPISLCLKRSVNASWRVARSSVEAVLGWPGFAKIVGVLPSGNKNEDQEVDLAFQVDRFRSEVEKLEKKKGEIESKVANLQKKVDTDFGPDGVWEKLFGKCFSLENGEYTYEACMLDRATQKSNSGVSTSLGTFSRWGSREDPDSPNKYNIMLFKNGQLCWNGPERSVEDIDLLNAKVNIRMRNRKRDLPSLRTIKVRVQHEDEDASSM